MKLIFSVIVGILLVSLGNTQGGGGGGGGGSSRSCSRTCAGDPTCLENCQRIQTIVGASVGGVLGAVFLGFVARRCFTTNKRCICHKYQSLKKKYNQVDGGNMS